MSRTESGRPGPADPMSRTAPVRWWRDDASRYRRRPPYVAPPPEPIEWAFELLRLTPEQAAELARCRE